MADTTTLICLFHHEKVAQAALHDLMEAGILATSVSLIDRDGPREEHSGASLDALGVPKRDQKHLLKGVQDGGFIVAVSAISEHEEAVENIFQRHSAAKIDEAEREIAVADQGVSSRADAVASPPNSIADLPRMPSPAAQAGATAERRPGDVRTLRLFQSAFAKN